MELSERTIFTERVRETTEFYRTVLGREPIVENESIAIFEEGQTTLLIHETYEAGEDDLPADDHVAYGAEDLDRSFEELASSGLDVMEPPAEYEWGRSAYFEDPDGRIVELRAE